MYKNSIYMDKKILVYWIGMTLKDNVSSFKKVVSYLPFVQFNTPP